MCDVLSPAPARPRLIHVDVRGGEQILDVNLAPPLLQLCDPAASVSSSVKRR